ncbi:MDIS1-interacting receptor like kinase 2-like protein [Tanacetum coccineum]
MLPNTIANNFHKKLEARALADWLGRYVLEHYCTWSEITCNDAGSVISIQFDSYNNLPGPYDLESLDFTSFPNLEYFFIESCNLEESIPEQIGMH